MSDKIIKGVLIVLMCFLFFKLGQNFPPEGYELYNAFYYREDTLFITQSAMTEINEIHELAKEEVREYGVCLEMEGDTITGIEGEYVVGGDAYVNWTGIHCTWASLHTHFDHGIYAGACRMSPLDVLYLDAITHEGTKYEMIICGKDKVVAFDREEMQRPYKIEVVE